MVSLPSLRIDSAAQSLARQPRQRRLHCGVGAEGEQIRLMAQQMVEHGGVRRRIVRLPQRPHRLADRLHFLGLEVGHPAAVAHPGGDLLPGQLVAAGSSGDTPQAEVKFVVDY